MDVQIHYVIGGHGNFCAVILLHGWPETWYECRDVMALAKNHTVIAPDLR